MGKVRYRLGIDAQLNNKVKVGAGITTGGLNPRSSFAVFENSFERKELNLDYAYGEWKAATWASVIMGKYPSDQYLWHPTDMAWDPDLKPEGASAHLEKSIIDGHVKGFVNGGVMVIDEAFNRQDDPTMYYVQPGVRFEQGPFDAQFSVQRFAFNSVNSPSIALDHSSCSNSGLTPNGDPNVDSCGAGSKLQLEYDSGGAGAEIGYKFMDSKRFAVFGEYVKNLATSVNDVGWAAGGRVGSIKVEKFGDWQLLYQYTYLQRDAVLDIFPNSDRYNGETNIRGIKGALDFGLWSNIKVGLSFYNDDRIKDAKARKTTLLSDVTYSF